MAAKKKKAGKKSAKKAAAKKKSAKKAAGKGGKKSAKKAAKKSSKKAAKTTKRTTAKKASGKSKVGRVSAKKTKGKVKAAGKIKKSAKKTTAKAKSGAGRAIGAGLAGLAVGAMLASSEGGSPSTEEESARAIPDVGSVAPDFSLAADDGHKINLGDFRGSRKVVLYFYPKDDTPGCTKEACDFTADSEAFLSAGAQVFGVSPDGAASHVKFRHKFHITFPLLVDEGANVAKKFGAWGEKNMYGRITQGIIRSTFLIDTNGKIARVWPKVRVEGHSQEVLAAVRSL